MIKRVLPDIDIPIDVANRDYHHLSQTEIDGAKRIYRHLSRSGQYASANSKNYCSFACSAFASFRIGMSESASFQSMRNLDSAAGFEGGGKAAIHFTGPLNLRS